MLSRLLADLMAVAFAREALAAQLDEVVAVKIARK